MARRSEVDEDVVALSNRVATNLKRLRSQRGLTLDELGRLCRVSRATLSQIETRGTNPTLAVLWKIANGLDVPFSALIGDDESHGDIRTVDIAHLPQIRSGDDGAESRAITPGRQLGDTDIYELTLAPSSVLPSEAHPAGTLETLIVTEGQVEVETGDDIVRATPRHAIVFHADRPHRYHNPGQATARAINVIVYRGRR